MADSGSSQDDDASSNFNSSIDELIAEDEVVGITANEGESDDDDIVDELQSESEDEVIQELDSESGRDSETDFEQSEPEPTPGVTWNMPFRDDAEEFDLLTHQPNSELGLTTSSTPFEVLQKFLTPEMIEDICKESLRYAEQKGNHNFTSFHKADFWKFFALHLGMGIDKKPNIQMYWSKKNPFYTPFFADVMSRKRFLTILKNLHFQNDDEIPANNKDRFIKLGSFLDKLVKNFQCAVHPGEYLCLDESMVPFKGRLSIKQYNPKKRARFGVKLFILVDCQTKMILDIVPYQGKTTKMKFRELMSELGFGGTTVLTMLEPYFGSGHRVIIHNWFNSPTLARILIGKKTYVLGTVQRNRKGMPKGSLIKPKLPRGGVQTFSDGEILIERWNDRREVYLLNTFMDHIMIPTESRNPTNSREKPGTVLLYNSKMGAVDDADKIIKPYTPLRKSYKWYRKVIFRLMDFAVYNSYLLFQQLQATKLPYLDYLHKLIANILQQYPTTAVPRGRPSCQVRDGERLSGPHHPQKTKRSRCCYCRKVYGLRVTTMFRCMQCKAMLCIDSGKSCFHLYHSQPTLRKIPAEYLRKKTEKDKNAKKGRKKTSSSRLSPVNAISSTESSSNLTERIRKSKENRSNIGSSALPSKRRIGMKNLNPASNSSSILASSSTSILAASSSSNSAARSSYSLPISSVENTQPSQPCFLEFSEMEFD